MKHAAHALPRDVLIDRRFLLFETLGSGGMGRVYRAFDRIRGCSVALKMLEESGSPERNHPLAAEFESWVRLAHPNVVRAFEFGRSVDGPLDDGTPYLVLEYFPGLPAHRVLRPGRVGDARLTAFARQTLLGLGHVHRAGLVHRDLKPGNVLVSPGSELRVKLTDFGLAERSGIRRLPGHVSGSLPYLSPESMLGGPIDARADLYAFGVLLFFLATGRPAAEGGEPERLIRWHLEGRTADPRRLRPGLDRRLARLIGRLTERQRALRPSCAEEALEDLGVARRPPLLSRPRRLSDPHRLRLRLAFDEARLGGRRLLRLPRGEGRAVGAELRALAGLHGVRWAALGRCGGRRPLAALARTVLRMLLDAEEPAAGPLRRHRLDSGLPLTLLGEAPVWDRARAGRPFGFDDAAARRRAARGIAAFVLRTSVRRTWVLQVGREALADPLVRDVVRALRSAVRRAPRARCGGRGGLLLVF